MPEEEVWNEEEIRKALGYGYPEAEEKADVISFFREIIRRAENIKTANLTNEEVGWARLPVRTNIDIANYCELMGMQGFSTVFEKDAQTTLGTSLSREGFLDKLAVTQKKESQTSLQNLKGVQKKKGWFGKKEVMQEEGI